MVNWKFSRVATQSVKRLFASIDGRKSPKRILRGVPAAIVASKEGYTLGKALEHMLYTKHYTGDMKPYCTIYVWVYIYIHVYIYIYMAAGYREACATSRTCLGEPLRSCRGSRGYLCNRPPMQRAALCLTWVMRRVRRRCRRSIQNC